MFEDAVAGLEAVEVDGVEDAVGLGVEVLRFLVSDLAISAGFWRSAKTSAALPRASRLRFLDGSLRSRCCWGVSVLVPSLRYLKELRLRDSMFCGSCRVMMSFLPNPCPLTRSSHIFALMLSRSTVSWAKTLPVVRKATMCVLSVKTLNVTGSTISPSSFFAKLSLIRSVDWRGAPLTGFVPCFRSQGRMLSMSKMVPSEVQTGDLKGWRETAQKLYGRRLKGAPAPEALARPEPALAEKASSEAHSLWVI